MRQRLQRSLALPIRVQPARHAEGQLWQIGPAVRLLATRPAEAALPLPAEYPRLLVYDYVSRQLGARLQAQGTYYADAAGNAWLRHPALLVSLQGCPRPKAPAAPDPLSPLQHVHLLRLLFQLLLKPALATYAVPHLAAHAQLPLAVVRQALRSLTQQGHWQAEVPLGHSPLQLPDPAQYWLTHYPRVLRRRLNAQRYRPRRPVALADWLPQARLTHCLLSGEAAARQLLGYAGPPTSLTLHSAVPRPQLLRQLDLVPSPQGPIELLTAFFSIAPLADSPLPCVPPLLVQADLLATPTPTSEALAQELRARYLPELPCPGPLA